MDKDSGRASNNQEAAVVDQLIKKLRPFDKSFVSERASAVGARPLSRLRAASPPTDRKSTRLNSSHLVISYAVFCLKKKKKLAQSVLHVLTLPPHGPAASRCC